jgi:hypothetical protein
LFTMPKKARKVKKMSVPKPLSVMLEPVDSNPTFNRTFRFTASGGANNLIISRGDLLNLLQIATASGTGAAGARLINCIELRWIRVRPGVSSAVAITTVSLTWLGQYAKSKTETLSVMGSSNVPELLTKPPKNSVAGFWAVSGIDETENVFSMDLTVGTVVDVNVSFVLQNFIATPLNPVATTSTKTVTSGVVYCAALDGTSTNIFTPLGALQW